VIARLGLPGAGAYIPRMRILVAIVAFLVLTGPASALCVVKTGDGEDSYPQNQEELILCQQRELSDAVNDRAAAEQLRALRAQVQALQLQQQRLLIKPFNAFDVPRF
jgi:hypothetical protein